MFHPEHYYQLSLLKCAPFPIHFIEHGAAIIPLISHIIAITVILHIYLMCICRSIIVLHYDIHGGDDRGYGYGLL